jgi:hypothetical protein
MGSYWSTRPIPCPVQETKKLRDSTDTEQYVRYQYTSTCTVTVRSPNYDIRNRNTNEASLRLPIATAHRNLSI